jgi:hypothetical protein
VGELVGLTGGGASHNKGARTAAALKVLNKARVSAVQGGGAKKPRQGLIKKHNDLSDLSAGKSYSRSP